MVLPRSERRGLQEVTSSVLIQLEQEIALLMPFATFCHAL